MKLTVFTPAYNRAELLPRLYRSLLEQTCGGFEWLVVDDGSTDDTESVVAGFAAEEKLPVRYVRKENGGKHSAHNLALEHARGEWFFCVDSDDQLAPSAVTAILTALKQVDKVCAGLAGYKISQTGELLCAKLESGISCGPYSLVHKYGGKGEYALLFRTEVLRRCPFPVVQGERFVTECVLYDRLELAGYTVCPLPEVLQICEYQPDGLSSNTYRLMKNSPTGYQIYHAQRIDLARSLRERLGHCIRYQAFYAMSRNKEYCYSGRHRLLTALMYLPGLLGACYYRNKAESI